MRSSVIIPTVFLLLISATSAANAEQITATSGDTPIASANGAIDVKAVQKAIDSAGASWIAGETAISRMSHADRAKMLSMCGRDLPADTCRRQRATMALSYPPVYDCGQWMTIPKNMGLCGAGACAFPLAGMFEARYRRLADEHYRANVDIDLSEQYLISCLAGTCDSCDLRGMYQYLQDEGVPDETCFPYTGGLVSCDPCADVSSRLYTIRDYFWPYTWQNTDADEMMQEIYENGPILTWMVIYEDFHVYEGGIYEQVWGSPIAYDFPIIVYGWGDEAGTDFWLCKNCWGTDWGETGPGGTEGWFRIRRGVNEVNCEEYITYATPKFDDADGDDVPDQQDNCPDEVNPEQIDADTDGYGVVCDCDDDNENVYPGADEVLNDGIDQDCNGFDAITCFVDADQDGDGNDDGITTVAVDGSCDTGDGESNSNHDCDDTDTSIYGDAPEIVDDGIDQDCNGFDAITCIVDADQDGDGNDDGITTVAEDGSCDRSDGESIYHHDCDDTNPDIHGGAPEVCNGIDDNCNGVSDDPYGDMDSDGWGDACDNCPSVYNPGQEDFDEDEIGDACDGCCGRYTGGTSGNTNCSDDGKLTLSDITRLIDRVYISKDRLCCEADGNTNASADCKITLSDITVLIDAVYISKVNPEACMPECEQ